MIFILFSLLSLGTLMAPAAPGRDTNWSLDITPFQAKSNVWGCRSVLLDPTNALGSISFEEEGQVVRMHVLYRSRPRRGGIELRLMRDDARVLGEEIAALLRKERVRPIRFEAKVTRERACMIYRIVA